MAVEINSTFMTSIWQPLGVFYHLLEYYYCRLTPLSSPPIIIDFGVLRVMHNNRGYA